MSTIDFITELFCHVDDAMKGAKKHSQANLYPSEVVTLAILFALKGVGNRAFYRWLERDYKQLFPNLGVVHKGHSKGSGIFTIEQALGRAADNVKQSALVGWEEAKREGVRD